MSKTIYVFDPTVNDKQSEVRGIGRYLQILKENFPNWTFVNKLQVTLRQSSGQARYKLQEVFVNPFFNFLKPPLIMRRIAKKQIAVIHDLIPLKYLAHFPAGIRGNINIFLNKLALRNYDLIVTDSQASKKDIVQMLHVDENKVKVIYPCLPKVFTNPKLQIPITKKISNSNNQKIISLGNWKLEIGNSFCLYVGDATWNKNLVNLAKAIKIANVTCVFVGKVFDKSYELSFDKAQDKQVMSYEKLSPWLEEFNDFLQEVKTDKHFIFLGYVDDYELIKLYQQAKVNMLVSRDEGFGFSYLEASSQHCPSILSDIPVLREIGNSSPLFVNPKNPSEIASKIGEIYSNNKLRNELAEKALQRTKIFSADKFIKSFLDLID